MYTLPISTCLEFDSPKNIFQLFGQIGRNSRKSRPIAYL